MILRKEVGKEIDFFRRLLNGEIRNILFFFPLLFWGKNEMILFNDLII